MINASKTAVPATIVLKTVRTKESVTVEDRLRYSRMKHGDPQSISYFASLMAHKIYSQMFLSGAVDISEEVVITSSAYGEVPTASYALMKEISRLLASWGVKLLEIKIGRQGDFATTHYGSMSMAERRSRMQTRQIYLSEEARQSVDGKIVIVIDDINVTGSHEETLRSLFKTTAIKRQVFCYLYGFSKFMASSEPHLEDFFNHADVKSVGDLASFFTQENSENNSLIINARALKFILDTDDTPERSKIDKLVALKDFLSGLSGAVLLQLYKAAASSDGYHNHLKFVDGFYILADLVVSRRLVRIEAVARLKGNTVFKFISIDNNGNLIDMSTGENENDLGCRYSLMKFGSACDINWFGANIAQSFISRLNDPADDLLDKLRQIGENHEHIALVSPGSRNVESAQNFIFEVAIKRLNVYLALHGLPTIILIKMSRFESGVSNYAELDAVERFRRKRSESLSKSVLPGEDFFGAGVHAIFADDVRITGASADRVENTFLQRGARSFSSMYCLVVDPKNVLADPSIEQFLNQFLIKGDLNDDITYILNQPGFRPVQRMMRLILGEKNRSQLYDYLHNNVRNSSLIKLYEASLGNNFHQDSRYADSIMILRQVLWHRQLVDDNGLLKG